MMRLFLKLHFLLSVFLVVIALPVFALASENIPLYEVIITPRADATIEVQETVYYDFARNYKHGITRTIPLTHPQESSAFYKERYLDIEIISATLDGVPTLYEATEQNGELFIKIGDPNITMTTEHAFTLTYVVRGGLHYYADGLTELYWDAIGAQSQVPTLEAVVKIHDVEGVTTDVTSCYVGAEGTQTPCEKATTTSDLVYVATDLEPYEGMTVAVALDESVPQVILERVNWWYFTIPIGLLTILGFIFGAYRYRTTYRSGRPIIAQYEPYADMEPMYTGVLLDDRLDPKDITAGIITLAQRGYLKIRKTEAKVLFFFEVDDYEITLLREPAPELSRFERDVLGLIFTSFTVGEQVSLSKLKTDLSKQRDNQSTLTELRADLKKDMLEKGFFQNLNWKEARSLVALALGVTLVTMFFFLPLAILFIVLMVVFLIISRRRTRKGYEALDHLKGFKDFLSTTEKERYKFHNAPKKSPEQFMQFLPYAVALDVEKEWAEVFKDVTIPDPSWYDGSTAGAFSATDLTHSLGAFSTAFASSTSSSGSGSSGGGSVGGGGGGGSVGSW